MTDDRKTWIVPLTFLITFAVYYLTALPLLDDSDVPWHLAAGRWMLAHHQIPTTDPWSFATNGEPWYLLSWIWDLVLGATEKCFGLFGVLIFVLALSAAIPALIARHLLRIGVVLPAVFFTTMIASLCIMDFITARPHLSGYLMAFIFYLILHRSRMQGERYGRLLLLPPLMLVWANMHGSFIAGFSVLAAYGIEAYVSKNKPWLKRLVLITLACVVMAAINPYGLDVMLGAMKTLGGSAKQYTIEWLPFAFSASTGVSAWLILFILAGNLRGSRVALADKLLATGWLIGTFFVMRNGPIFIILSATYLATCLGEATTDLREERKPSAFAKWMERQPIARVWAACIALMALGITAAYHLPHEDKILSDDMSVRDAIAFAEQKYPTHHYLTDFNFGGQVIYDSDGTLPMWMDSRAATAYGEEAMEDYLEFLWQKDGWEERLVKRGVNALMIGNTTLFAKAYDQGLHHDRWKLVFTGTRANIYLFTSSAHPARN